MFRAFKDLWHRVWGIHVLLEVDAKFLKQMIKEPDLPNALMTRWVSYLQLFDYHLKHIPAAKGVAQDGLSRRRPAPDDSEESDAEEYLDKFFRSAAFVYNSGVANADFSRLELVTAFRYDAMEPSPRAVAFCYTNRFIQPANVDLPQVALVSLSEFQSARAENIEEWQDRHWNAPPSSRVWDSNIVSEWPAWWHVTGGIRPSPSFGYKHAHSPFHPALLRNEDDVTYVGREFMVQKER